MLRTVNKANVNQVGHMTFLDKNFFMPNQLQLKSGYELLRSPLTM